MKYSGNDEVHSIQNQLNSLKLNPYREVKLVNEGGEDATSHVTAISDELLKQQRRMVEMNMGQQFMYAMQKSVSQVINAPHFGFEWVKPDYYFDPIDEDVKPVISSPYHINKDDDTESSVNSVVSDSEIRELYNALEEFTNKEDAQELLQYGSVQ